MTKKTKKKNNKLLINYITCGVLVVLIIITTILLILPKVSTPEIMYETKQDSKWNQKYVIKVSKDSKSKYKISYYEYCINDTKEEKNCDWKTTNTKNVEVFDNGHKYVHVRGVDEKERKSNSALLEVLVDNISPTINDVKVTNKTDKEITIKTDANDNLSSITYQYSLDGLNYLSGEKEYTFTNLKSKNKYRIFIKVIDEALNEQIVIIEEKTL